MSLENHGAVPGHLCEGNMCAFRALGKSKHLEPVLNKIALSGGNLLINKKTFLARAQCARVVRPDAKTKLDSIAQEGKYSATRGVPTNKGGSLLVVRLAKAAGYKV